MMKNEKGPIADQYSELQAIASLEDAKNHIATTKASNKSLTKAVLQAVIIGIENLNDLLIRITNDIAQSNVQKAGIKIGWYSDINWLVNTILQSTSCIEDDIDVRRVSIEEFSSAISFLQTIRNFDIILQNYINNNSIDIGNILEKQSSDNEFVRLINNIRQSNYNIVIWGKKLSALLVNSEITNIEDFIGHQFLHKAVHERKLEGDTFFTQFRGLHQIPEILSAEANDFIEDAIINIKNGDIIRSIKSLRVVNTISLAIMNALVPIVNNLTTSDYYEIRENLGLTSGSHSKNIHYYLFKDLYKQLGQTFIDYFFKNENQYKSLKLSEGIVSVLENEILHLSAFTYNWRDIHLHLPRNNVGGNFTKSLIGSSDAVEAAKKMQISAYNTDPLLPILKIGIQHESVFERYFNSEESFDSNILNVTGKITQNKFSNVQGRTGLFSNKPPFTPPEKRTVK